MRPDMVRGYLGESDPLRRVDFRTPPPRFLAVFAARNDRGCHSDARRRGGIWGVESDYGVWIFVPRPDSSPSSRLGMTGADTINFSCSNPNVTGVLVTNS